MKRPLVWLGLCLALLLGGVAWLSVTALRFERQAAVEEGARLALWRLDSNVAPILGRESSRPASGFLAAKGESDEFVVLRFEVGSDGQVQGSGEAVSRFRGLVTRPGLLAALGTTGRSVVALAAGGEERQQRSANEYAKRWRNVEQNAAQQAMDRRPEAAQRETMRPVWVEGELVLLRHVAADGDDLVQGVWLDWPVLRASLLLDIADLFPGAALEPAGPKDTGERLLASLPVRLTPGRPAGAPGGEGAPLGLVLGGAWAAVLVAAAAMALLLFGTLALSERRAAFVSAVTHELRTPLTTLRTYTEMLAGGMVREEKRAGYLATLAREAERLARLVDNVLLYARLERGKKAKVEEVSLVKLLDEVKPRLEERAAAAGMTVNVVTEGAASVKADPVALEQIIYNLVDNACKYGAGEVRIEAGADGVVHVSDGGGGIAAEDRRWLFEPFARSAERAAGEAPGVGLGLALCRQLARAMGGDLVLEEGAHARFAVRLRATGNRQQATGNRQ